MVLSSYQDYPARGGSLRYLADHRSLLIGNGSADGRNGKTVASQSATLSPSYPENCGYKMYNCTHDILNNSIII